VQIFGNRAEKNFKLGITPGISVNKDEFCVHSMGIACGITLKGFNFHHVVFAFTFDPLPV
jgi:hypothetical protein